MIYADGIWVKENVCDLPADKQNEIRKEVTAAYRFFGYRGQRLEKAVARAMDSELVEVCNLLGAYESIRRDSEISAKILLGETVDSAIQSTFER